MRLLPLLPFLPCFLLAACDLLPPPPDATGSAGSGASAVEPAPTTVDRSPFTVREIALPQGSWPMGLAMVDDALWVADARTQTVLVLSPNDGALVATHPHDGVFPAGLALHGDTVLATDLFDDGRIQRLAPGQEAHAWPLPYHQTWPWAVAADDERIYVLNARHRRVIATDPVDGSELFAFTAPGKRPSGLAWDGQHLWSADIEGRALYMLDPDHGWVLHALPSPALVPSGLTWHQDSLYVSDLTAGKVFQVQPFANEPWVEDMAERYRVTFRLDLLARGEGALQDLQVAVAIPETRPGQALLAEPDFDPQPSEIVTEPSGQRLALFHVERLEAGEHNQVEMNVEVEARRVRFQIDPKAVPAPKNNAAAPGQTALATADPRLEPALADGRKYDLSHETVQERVARVVGDEAEPYARARLIYEDLVDAITYDRSGGWGAAPTVLDRGTGSCSEYTFALVSLLRAAGVPSRYVGAMVRRGPHGGVDHVFHRWTEIWLGERWGWIPVDANAGASDKPEERGGAFGGLDNRFLVTTVSYGESEHLDWTYNYNVTYEVQGAARLEEQPIAVWTALPSTQAPTDAGAPEDAEAPANAGDAKPDEAAP